MASVLTGVVLLAVVVVGGCRRSEVAAALAISSPTTLRSLSAANETLVSVVSGR